MARPATGQTPAHGARYPHAVWRRLVEIAGEDDRSITAVLIEAAVRYIAYYDRKQRRQSRS